MEEAEKILLTEALKNAIKFNGKANEKAVLGKLMRDLPEFRSKSQEIKPLLSNIVKKVNSWNTDKQTEELLKLDPHALDEEEKKGPEEKTLPELPNVKINDKKNPVVMRLAPYPSGALHIGNARMIVLNDEYVKKYKGKLILCFDDTIGATKKAIEEKPNAKYVIPEAYDLILDGLDWLGIKYDKKNIAYKSDRIDIYQKYAEQFIKDENAYVCTCTASDFRENYKKPGKPCPCRSKSTEEHLERWERMLGNEIQEKPELKPFAEGEAVVRLKTGMDQKDPALRDHVIMRISDATHPRIGNKCRVWPILDFSWGIDDYELGITHILRGADLQKEGFMEQFIWDLLGWKKREILLYGRLKFSDELRLSKTEARMKISSGEYDGWNDPRTWSLQSLRERGIKPEALRESLLDLGMSMSGINFSEDWIYSKNTKIIDPIANRYWFVEKPIPIEISGLDKELYTSHPLLNPGNEKLGTRTVELTAKKGNTIVYISKLDTEEQRTHKGDKIRYPKMKIGDTFRLKDLFTIEIDEISESSKNKGVEKIKAHFLTKEVDKKIRKIQWVPGNDYCRVKVLKPNGIVLEGYAENNINSLKESDILQFERYGYVKINKIKSDYIYCYFAH